MDILLINTMHPDLEIPAFYTIIPGAHFRERALGTSVGMFASKHIADNRSPQEAIVELKKIDKGLPGKYYVKFFDIERGKKCLYVFKLLIIQGMRY